MSDKSVHARLVREKQERRERAHLRLRKRVRGTAERPRLAVFKSLKHVYAQVIDDQAGRTLAAASTVDTGVREKLGQGATSGKAAARAVGEVVADRAKEKGITRVVFDRGGYIFHGKVKEVADAARKQGLDF
jgi:large subunit ribosomal protein L18